MTERPTAATVRVAAALGMEPPSAAEHTEVFVHQLPPYASIYLGTEGGIGGAARDAVGGFWRAVGMVPPSEPDHLAALLGLWASLVEVADDGAHGELAGHAATALVREHLTPWLTPYLMRIREVASGGLSSWSALLAAAVAASAGDDCPLPRHLDDAPSATTTVPNDVVSFLLTPVRSGIIVTRRDLARAASEIGLGLRIGERAYALQAMLDQDAGAVIGWMADEAAGQAVRHGTALGPPVVCRWWATRARATHAILSASA